MRKQILGTAAAAAITGAVTLGVPAAPAHADAWHPLTPVPFPAGAVSEVAVVATGPGDAVAAAIINGSVHAYTAVHGTWTHHSVVANNAGASGLVLASDGDGDTAVAWEQTIGSNVRLRARRQAGPGSWSATQSLTPAGTDVVGTAELGVAGNGRVVAAAVVDGEEVDNQLLVTEWAEGKTPGAPKVISHGDAWNPALAVNESGRAVLAYHYDGLVTDVVDVHVRVPGEGWGGLNNAGNDGNLASTVDVALSDDGTGQVVWSAVSPDGYRIQTVRVRGNGTVTKAEGYLSPADESASEPRVDMNAAGSALFTWTASKGQTPSVRYAAAARDTTPTTSTVLPGTLTKPARPLPRLSDDGLRVIQHHGSGQVRTHFRSGQQLFDSVSTGAGFGDLNAVDVDSEGNAVMVGVKNGTSVHARFLDASGPVTTLTGPQGAQQLSTTFPVSWEATDSLSDVAGASVIARESAWNAAGFTAPAVVTQALGSPVDFSGDPGTTYCIAVQARDALNNSGTRTPERCTTLPLDDTSLVGGKVWKRATGSGHYLDTVTRTDRKGAVLTRGGIRAKRLALVVQRAPKGGKVRATFGGTVLGTFGLKGTGKKKTITLATFPKVRTGKLKITVVSADGRKVAIDGLVVAK